MLVSYNQSFTPASVTSMLKGLCMTVVITVLAAVISMAVGMVLALVHAHASGPQKWLGGLMAVYMESFRCTLNLFRILQIYFTVRGSKIVVFVFVINLFILVVMAEIFRGGLNAIPKRQFEAVKSQGFGSGKTLWYIVLPRIYKKVIPALLNQVITVIKNASSLKMADVAGSMRNCGAMMGSIYNTRDMLVLLVFEALYYFIICFTLSCVVRVHQKTIVTA